MIISKVMGVLGNQHSDTLGRLVSIRRKTERWLDVSFPKRPGLLRACVFRSGKMDLLVTQGKRPGSPQAAPQ
jgi:hypothetical protein